MFPHKDFAQYCIQAICAQNTGFLLSKKELFLRDAKNELTIFMVIEKTRNKEAYLPAVVTAYKRSCELVFHYLSLTTQIPNTLDEVRKSDTWPRYERSRTSFKRSAPEVFEEKKDKRTKIEQNYRFHIDAMRLEMLQNFDKLLVEKFIANIDRYIVIAWGMVAYLLTGTGNPFWLAPVFIYGCTAAEWLRKVLADADVTRVVSLINKYEKLVIVYSDKEENFIVAKRQDDTPLVFLDDPRPIENSPKAFMTALFFYLYAGGTKGALQINDLDYLKFCLSKPVTQPLILEENKRQAASGYKRVLLELTDGRTQEEILNQFSTVEDMANNLIVDCERFKFDIATVYVHPENQKIIKLVKGMCRWTNLTLNPPGKFYVNDRSIRQALILSSGEVDIAAIHALADEADFSSFRVLWIFSDLPYMITEDELNCTYANYWNEISATSGRLNLEVLKNLTTELELKRQNVDYFQVNKEIAYYNGKFHAITKCSDQSCLLNRLNEESHLQLLHSSDSLPVSNLFKIDLDLTSSFKKAPNNKLNIALRQAEVLQKDVDALLKPILQNAFTKGPWRLTTVQHSMAATLQAAFANKDTYWTEFHRFWENEQNPRQSSNLVSLYLVQNTDFSFFAHYSKARGIRIYEIQCYALDYKEELTSFCNEYDVKHLFQTPLANDLNFLVFILHLLFTFKRKLLLKYEEALDLFKTNMFVFADQMYKIKINQADGFGVFDSKMGEDLLSHFLEKTFLSLTKPYSSLTAVNAVNVIKDFTHEGDAITDISTGGGTLFIIKSTRTPVLYLFSGVNSYDRLYSTFFDLWLASDEENVGFLNIANERNFMETDEPPDFYLTLVYTTSLYHIPLPHLVKQYGTTTDVYQQNKHVLSEVHQKLINWAGTDIVPEDVGAVISSHTLTLLRHTSNKKKRYSINFFDKATLNNTLSDCDEETIANVRRVKQTPYASLQVSSEKFAFIFSQKMVK